MPNIRKPNAIHKVNGTYRPDRHGAHGTTLDDQGLPSLPPPPTWLHPIGVMEWRRVVEILEPFNLLKATDYGILLGYCTLFAHMAVTDAEEVKTTLFAQFRGYCNDLGLTPVARSKVHIESGKSKDDDNPYNSF